MQSSDQQLSLAHLNKLFNEIKISQYASRDIGSTGIGGGPSKYDIQAYEAINEYESKIYRLLPLFLKVFGPSATTPSSPSTKPSVEMFEKFSDLSTLTSMVSRLMVTEIRRRASNKTTQEASETIVYFLEIPQEEISSTPTIPASSSSSSSSTSSASVAINQLTSLARSQLRRSSGSSNLGAELSNNNNNNNNNQSNNDHKGWILLSTLNLLVCNGSDTLIPIMAANSLPSTLVKCLYLFFDLPQPASSNNLSSSSTTPPSTSTDSSLLSSSTKIGKLRFNSKGMPNASDSIECLTPTERRLLLHKVFGQLLTRLCAHQASLHELTRKDDLALLFNAVTSWCVSHNRLWRQTAADVILIMAKCNCINTAYLHDKSCISVSIENISRMSELSKASEDEIADMLSTIINCMTEIYYAHPPSVGILLDDFKANLGYHFIVDFVLKLERDVTNQAHNIRKTLSLVTAFTKVGTSELKPRPLSVNQLFIMSEFSWPKPNPKHSIKNLSAFNVLQTLWFKARSILVHELILAGLFSLYRDDRANYFILDSQNTLSQFADKLHLRAVSVQVNFTINHLKFLMNYTHVDILLARETLMTLYQYTHYSR